MGDRTGIEWTEATWNPVVGCSLKSPGCTNCYAMGQAARIVRMTPSSHYEGTVQSSKAGPVWTGVLKPAPEHITLQPLRWRRPRFVFVNSMSDLFHEAVPDDLIDRVFAVMALCPQHTFQILTKRPERMRAYLSAARSHPVGMAALDQTMKSHAQDPRSTIGANVKLQGDIAHLSVWPLPNVWLGVSVEDQRRADERIPLLLETPAAVRWISAEPLLGPLALSSYLLGEEQHGMVGQQIGWRPPLDWVVIGGESGHEARPMLPDWARAVRDQCATAEVPFLFKQWGEWVSVSEVAGPGAHHTFPDGSTVRRVGKKAAGRRLDGELHDAYPQSEEIVFG